MTEKSLEDVIEEIFRMELKVSNRFDTIQNNYTQEDIEQACGNVISNALNNTDSEDTKRKLWLLYGQIGQKAGSEDMVEMVMSKVNTDEAQ